MANSASMSPDHTVHTPLGWSPLPRLTKPAPGRSHSLAEWPPPHAPVGASWRRKSLRFLLVNSFKQMFTTRLCCLFRLPHQAPFLPSPPCTWPASLTYMGDMNTPLSSVASCWVWPMRVPGRSPKEAGEGRGHRGKVTASQADGAGRGPES